MHLLLQGSTLVNPSYQVFLKAEPEQTLLNLKHNRKTTNSDQKERLFLFPVKLRTEFKKPSAQIQGPE